MENYVIPNVGDKPIKNVTADELQAIINVYALMGNISINGIKQNIKSLIISVHQVLEVGTFFWTSDHS